MLGRQRELSLVKQQFLPVTCALLSCDVCGVIRLSLMNRFPFQGLTLILALLLLSAALCPLSSQAATDESLRVGVYFNPPLSFFDQQGEPTGFIIEIMNHIALLEGWNLEYVSCSWEDCNELLFQGGIDLLAPMAVSDARQRRLDFNRESLYVNWGQMLVRDGFELNSPLDLAGKSVIALSGDVHFSDLKMLADRYDIDVRFLEVDDYEDVIAWVAEGPVDAGLVNRSFDLGSYSNHGLVKSPLIFNPAEIRIAFSPRNDQLQNALLSQRLDFHLARLKGNSNSVYHQIQARWFGSGPDGTVPLWVVWVLLVVASIALLLAVGVLILRGQVRRQTKRARAMSGRFTAFMQNLPGIAYMKGADGRFLFVNSVWERSRRLSSANVIGKTPKEIWQDHDLESESPEERQVIESGLVVETIENSIWDEETVYRRVIRFPIIDANGKDVLVGGIGLDISAQREAEQQTARLSTQLQLLLESAGEGIFGLDGLCRCSFINQTALNLLGYRREELIGVQLHDLIQHSRADGSSYPESESPILRAIKEGSHSRIVDEVFWHASGVPLTVEYTVHPIAEGEYPGAVVVFRETAAQSESAG